MCVLNMPHGGILVNRIMTGKQRKEALIRAKEYPKIVLDNTSIVDLELIATGAFSPLTGFMQREDYLAVLRRICLASGEVWTVPITLNVDEDSAARINVGSMVALTEKDGRILGIMDVSDKYQVDKELEVQLLYHSKRVKQNGMTRLLNKGEIALGGDIWLLNRPSSAAKSRYRLDPATIRKQFQQLGWKRIVAFQAPNPINNSRDSVEKCALDIVDGLLLHPHFPEMDLGKKLVTQKMQQHQKLISFYYPSDHILLAYYPWVSRNAGPREVALEALIKKNFGCTHYIIAEKQYTMNNFYTLMDFRRIFDEISAEDLGITPVFAEETFYCRKCKAVVTAQTCPHDRLLEEVHHPIMMNEMLSKGDIPPLEFIEKDVFPLLIDGLWNDSFSGVEPDFADNHSQLNPKLQRLVNGY